MRNFRKSVSCIVLAALLAGLLLSGGCLAENQQVTLPDGKHSVIIPEEMIWQEPAPSEKDLKGIFLLPPDLEMHVYFYEAGNATVRTLAEALAEAEREAEVREIAGTEFLVFQDQDEADGTRCVGYAYISEDRMTEISFFYATQAAADLTASIMESFQE